MLNKNLTRPIYRNATHIAKYRQINKKIFAFIIIISLLSVSTSAYSIVFQISKFTNNDTDDLGPIVYNGTIAWTGDNLGYEIFYWDGTSRTQVSATDSYNDFAHSLHNGTVAWSGNDGGPDHEIFYWDGTSVTQITDDDDHDWNPSVYNGTVAWYGYVGGGDSEIFYWDGNSITQITDNDINDYNPSLYNGTIAWDAAPAGASHAIYYWDGTSIIQVAANGLDCSLYNGTIAWRGSDGNDMEIYYWDGTSITQVTDNDIDEIYRPSLYNGTIAWTANDGNDDEIYFWDGTTITQVTNNDIDEGGCRLHNGMIAWAASDGNDREIYYAIPDTTPPAVTSSNPTGSATNVAENTVITATFSEAMDAATIGTTTFTVNNGVTGTVSYNADTKTATFTPTAHLSYNTTYSATITTGVEDLSGNPLHTNYIWSFTTESAPDTTSPSVDSNVPSNSSTDVAVNTVVTATFSEAMDASTISTTTFTVNNGVTGTVSYDANSKTATFTPTTHIAYNTTYTATITTGVEDLAGNPLQTDYIWSFDTGSSTDTTPPTVDSNVPANSATDVAVNTAVTATFSEAMDASTISTTTFTVNNGVIGTVSYDANNKTATFTPTTHIAYNTTYTATITTGVGDLAGNPLQTDYIWSFDTGSSPDTTPPTVDSNVPANSATDVAVNTVVTATFSEAMDASTISTTTFTVNNGVTGTISYDENTKTATFTPTTHIAYNTIYTATITTGVADLAGNALQTNYIWTFTTIPDTTPPMVTTTIPADGETNISVNTSIPVTFSENMDATTLNVTTFLVNNGTTDISGTVDYSGTTATFTPAAYLADYTEYTVTITTGATDLAGNALEADYTWSFTSGEAPDTTAPTVGFIDPDHEDTSVDIDTAIKARFSEAMNVSTINTNTFALNNGVKCTVTYDADTRTAKLKPKDDLKHETIYSATISTGVKDLAGNQLQDPVTLTFETQEYEVPPFECFISTVANESPMAREITILIIILCIVYMNFLKNKRNFR